MKSLLKIHGRAAVVVPDNVLFEGGAGEKVRRKLLQECEVHTLLRLPTGIFYAQGVKANVLFFDRKPGAKEPWTKKVWVYDLPHQQALHAEDQAHGPRGPRRVRRVLPPRRTATSARRRGPRRTPEGRWRAFTYEEIVARDKCSLDLFWLRDESLEDSANLPDPHVLAAGDRRRPARRRWSRSRTCSGTWSSGPMPAPSRRHSAFGAGRSSVRRCPTESIE